MSSQSELLAEVLSHAPADLKQGEFAVVCLSWETDGAGWNTGRTYATKQAAAAQQTRQIKANDCRAYMVYRHSAGTTVYLGLDHVLGTAPNP